MYAAEKDAGEKQMFRLTLLLRFLPYYLISNSVPFLITHQVLPRNYGYVIRYEAGIHKLQTSLIYLYQTPHIPVKEKFEKVWENFSSVQKYVITTHRKSALKGILTN